MRMFVKVAAIVTGKISPTLVFNGCVVSPATELKSFLYRDCNAHINCAHRQNGDHEANNSDLCSHISIHTCGSYLLVNYLDVSERKRTLAPWPQWLSR